MDQFSHIIIHCIEFANYKQGLYGNLISRSIPFNLINQSVYNIHCTKESVKVGEKRKLLAHLQSVYDLGGIDSSSLRILIIVKQLYMSHLKSL